MKKVIFLLLILLVSCSQTPVKERVTITVTIPTEKYFIDRLVGDMVRVNVMVPPEVGHSSYSPKPSQMVELSNSQVYLALGNLDFEVTWKERIVGNSGIRWVDLMSEDGDPHYWLSPKKAKIMAERMAEEMKKIVPEANIDSALEVLNADIEGVSGRLEGVNERAFFVFHPAMGHLEEDYGIRQFSVERNGSSSPKMLAENLDSAKYHGVKVIFLQSESEKEKAEVSAEYLGAKIVKILPESYDWLETMETIINGLR